MATHIHVMGDGVEGTVRTSDGCRVTGLFMVFLFFLRACAPFLGSILFGATTW